MISLKLVLMILALICLGMSAASVVAPRINLMALGLFLWLLASMVTM